MKSKAINIIGGVVFLICAKIAIGQNTHPGNELPISTNELFSGSGNCLMCHNSQINAQGENIGIINDWRSTMMANSGKDPFWRAKVSHEGLVNPNHKDALEDVCTRCHSPTGNKNAHYLGIAPYLISNMENDPLALDGVQCTVCHQINESSFGSFSGGFEINLNKNIYGPYTNPFVNPMINNTGYTPVHSPHINNSLLCAGCHTLITNSVDNQGNPTGNTFVEQAIYQEWLNSDYYLDNISCQACHVPRISEPVKISNIPPWLDSRSPFGMHHFTGSNVFMSRILKNNINELGLTADEIHFDSIINRSTRLLQNNSMNLSISIIQRSAQSLLTRLSIENFAGHKIPSGYPSRRLFIEFVVQKNNGDTLFHSGKVDKNWELIQENIEYESHYDTITNENQVQIYELVMGDINYNVTTVLERANYTIKDNRIPPIGFVSSNNVYDTVAIIGNAETDNNFNISSGQEGSGTDLIFFDIPTYGNIDELNISAKVYYQSVNGRWLENMFSYNSEEINNFKSIYSDSDKTPIIVAHETAVSNYTDILHIIDKSNFIYPNPSGGIFNINTDENIDDIQAFSLHGNSINIDKCHENQFKISIGPGVYLIKYSILGKTYSSRLVLR